MAYVYQPLQSDEHIRIIELDPSDDQAAPLHCSIVQQHLDDTHLPYDAISYTWSGQVRDRPMYVDRNQNVAHITANLDSALRRFRSRHKVRRLWADAACINQTDDVEKGKQIPHMGFIFRSARMVRAWLKDNSKSDYSRGMMRLAQAGKSRPRQRIEMDEDIYKFLSHKWFFRRWIIQELVLNSQTILYCGISNAAWSTLSLAIHRIMETNTQIDKAIQNLSTLDNLALSLGRGSTSPHDLLELLDKFSYHGCTDERDRIYALIGLAKDVNSATHTNGQSLKIVPDYSIGWQQAYCRLANALIRRDGLPSILFEVVQRRPSAGLTDLPSWVPDFRQPVKALPRVFSRLARVPLTIEPAEGDDNVLEIQLSVNMFRHCSFDAPATWDGLRVLGVLRRPLDVGLENLGNALRDLMAWIVGNLPICGDKLIRRAERGIARLLSLVLQTNWNRPKTNTCGTNSSIFQDIARLSEAFLEMLKDTKLSFAEACQRHEVIEALDAPQAFGRLSVYFSTSTYATILDRSSKIQPDSRVQIIGLMPCEMQAQDIMLIQSKQEIPWSEEQITGTPLFLIRKQDPGYQALGCGPYFFIGPHEDEINVGVARLPRERETVNVSLKIV